MQRNEIDKLQFVENPTMRNAYVPDKINDD